MSNGDVIFENQLKKHEMKEVMKAIPQSSALLSADGQAQGRVDVYDLESFKLHAYYTNDVMADVSYIIEGKDALVTLEHPLFKVNVTEFDHYLETLGKHVEQRITSYHAGGTLHHHVVMPEGMPAFTEGPVYSGMLQHFATSFGDTLTEMPSGSITEVPFDSTQTYAGVPFKFLRGASTDFPAASLLIGGKVYYSHWAASKSHTSPMQVNSAEAISSEKEAYQNALGTGAKLFIGSHGGVSDAEMVRFRIEYLSILKELLGSHSTAEEFEHALLQKYPNLPGKEGVSDLAQAIYRNK